MLWVILLTTLSATMDGGLGHEPIDEQNIQVHQQLSDTFILKVRPTTWPVWRHHRSPHVFKALSRRNESFVTRYHLAMRLTQTNSQTGRHGRIAFKVPRGTHRYQISGGRRLHNVVLKSVDTIPSTLKTATRA